MAAARPYKCKNMEEIIKMSDKVIYAAILGAGTVGLGTYKLCEAMSDEIKHKGITKRQTLQVILLPVT